MSTFKGKKVLITGGASGIGKLMGGMALDKGAAALVIWDINQASIEQVVSELGQAAKAQGRAGRVYGMRVDVSNQAMVADRYEQTKREVGEIDILINSAGIITSNKTFDQCTPDEINRTMMVNAMAPMYVAQQVLPDMVARNSGHICNIGSAGGMISNPRMSIYAASKWATIGWSDSVRIELREMRSRVRITTIAPYYITTGMFDGVRSKIFPLLRPENVASRILRAIERDTAFKMFMPWIPCPHHFIRLLQGILPIRVFDWLVGRVLGIYHTMDHFTGRKK
ncbi:MAG: SDR family NAD(P)-dependent oxidoreductase [Bacteroidaceae bacterium]|nr:SDR family NAD(P)-dependent oxidoreductase [Bacteroidaceae bacterium]